MSEVLTRASSQLTTLFDILTHVDAHRITFDVYMCAPVSIAHRLDA